MCVCVCMVVTVMVRMKRMFQSYGEDEEPAEWQHLAVGTWQVYEQTLPHSGEPGHCVLLFIAHINVYS